jgi:hypothetical protein
MAINDVSDAFGDWLESLTATRTAGSYVAGRWVDGSPTTVNFEGVVQNANFQDLQVLDEGDRSEETIKIHTTTKLIALVEGSTPGDVVSYDGFDWTVYSLADRKIGNYYKAILVKNAT